MLQAGVEGVVSALHHIPNGEVWTSEEIDRRKAEISLMRDGSPSGLAWDVVESLPVSEDIKKQKGEWRQHIANYKTSLRNIAGAGIEVLCYNFMPILDWTRTDLAFRLPHGGTSMRFDHIDFAAFDIHILQRKGAADSFEPEIVAEAEKRISYMNESKRKELSKKLGIRTSGCE